MINTPLLCVGPPSLTSRSMSMTLPDPGLTRHVTREGRPNASPEISSTLSAFTWPISMPSVEINSSSRSIA